MGSNLYDRYWELRKSPYSVFGYGLARRTEQLLSVVRRLELPLGRVVDMGCAEGTMLDALARIGAREAIGIDRFERGMPEASGKLRFLRHDLYREYPYPLEDGSVDLIVVSAFYKHHPSQGRFLSECFRALSRGGAIVLLEPRRWVVRIGRLLGYFNPAYCPNPWTAKSLAKDLPAALQIVDVENYWLSPWYRLRSAERLVPIAVARAVGLHQCVVVRFRK